jgi:hypothetical protein
VRERELEGDPPRVGQRLPIMDYHGQRRAFYAAIGNEVALLLGEPGWRFTDEEPMMLLRYRTVSDAGGGGLDGAVDLGERLLDDLDALVQALERARLDHGEHRPLTLGRAADDHELLAGLKAVHQALAVLGGGTDGREHDRGEVTVAGGVDGDDGVGRVAGGFQLCARTVDGAQVVDRCQAGGHLPRVVDRWATAPQWPEVQLGRPSTEAPRRSGMLREAKRRAGAGRRA